MGGTEVALKLGLSVRQVKRLKGRIKKEGPDGLAHRNLGKPSNRRVKKKITNQVIKLIKNRYYDCGPTFVSEKLSDCHSINLSTETVRYLMTQNKLWTPRKQRKLPQYRSRRERVARAGLLEQYDGSYHRWLGKDKEEYCLLAAIDDATGRITRAVLDKHEGVEPTFNFWRGYITEYGCLPKRLYLDKFSTYKVNHSGAEDNSDLITQFQRAMKTLGVELIFANSPQAKGRVERLFGTLQDRLVKELRLAGITDPVAANHFITNTFLPWFNNRFTVPPAKSGDVRLLVPKTADLDSIFSTHHTRGVNNDFTIRFENRWYQIDKEQSISVLRRDKVRVEKRLDGTVAIRHLGRNGYLKVTGLSVKPAPLPKQSIIPATSRQPYRPPANHPWRQFQIKSRSNRKKQTIISYQV